MTNDELLAQAAAVRGLLAEIPRAEAAYDVASEACAAAWNQSKGYETVPLAIREEETRLQDAWYAAIKAADDAASPALTLALAAALSAALEREAGLRGALEAEREAMLAESVKLEGLANRTRDDDVWADSQAHAFVAQRLAELLKEPQ